MGRWSALRRPAILAAGLLALHAALLAWGALRHAPTVDEPMHLTAGQSYWRTGRYEVDLGNPPLVGTIAAAAVLPMKEADEAYALEMVVTADPGIFAVVTRARWALIPFSLLGGWVCWRWARELGGTAAGFGALAMWTFCPMVLWRGQQVTGDMAATATGVLAFYLFWKWLGDPAVDRAFLAGLGLGMAELAKYVWVIAYPLFAALWIARRWADRGEQRMSLRREALDVGLMVVLSVFVINLGYCFEGSLRPLGEYEFESGAMKTLTAADENTADLNGRALPHERLSWIPVPLPAAYVTGIDEIAGVRETPYRPTYLRGRSRLGGWVEFYVYGLLVKTPLGYWLVIFAAAAASMGGLFAMRRFDELCLLLPAAVIVGFVTWSTSVQFLRYVLPALPFVFIWASRTFTGLSHRVKENSDEGDNTAETETSNHIGSPDPDSRLRRGVGLAAAAGLVAGIASSLWIYPHVGSFANLAAGGAEAGHRSLTGSSYDWGQDLLYLKDWVDAHPEAKPLYVAYSGCVHPSAAGIESTPFPADALVPGWYAVSVSLMKGGGRPPPGMRAPLRLLDELKAVRSNARAGWSIRIYHVVK